MIGEILDRFSCGDILASDYCPPKFRMVTLNGSQMVLCIDSPVAPLKFTQICLIVWNH